MEEKSSFKGTSTGQPIADRRRMQERKMKFERNVFYGNFSGDTKPTEEQRKLHMEKLKKAKSEKDRKKEKRRRGFITRKNRGDFNV